MGNVSTGKPGTTVGCASTVQDMPTVCTEVEWECVIEISIDIINFQPLRLPTPQNYVSNLGGLSLYWNLGQTVADVDGYWEAKSWVGLIFQHKAIVPN